MTGDEAFQPALPFGFTGGAQPTEPSDQALQHLLAEAADPARDPQTARRELAGLSPERRGAALRDRQARLGGPR